MTNKNKKENVTRLFAKYVSQNMIGMIGMSFYILADTFFISKAVGANGITALNLVLPLYSFIFAIGAMIGVGSAISFAIAKNQNNDKAKTYFFNAMFFATIISLLFASVGFFAPDKLVILLGGDDTIVEVGTAYTRIFVSFAPCFMWNYICNAFVRNDGAPTVAMAATLISSLFNIAADYILMFPFKMGMAGAALATACSPIIGIAICCVHFFSKKNTVTLKLCKPSIKSLIHSCKLGVSAFVGEISSGVITIAFNMIILKLVGNIGVAAYGIVANTSLVAVSVFNGISQGSQPLLSKYYATAQHKKLDKIMRYGIGTSVFFAVAIIALICVFAVPIAKVFNSENLAELTDYAVVGLRLYFLGFLFAGVNIFATSALSATNIPSWAFAVSILRGLVLILICAFVMSALFGMIGVWLAFPTAELLTMTVTAAALIKNRTSKVQ